MQFLNSLIRKIMRRYLAVSNSLTTFVRVMKQRVEEIDFLRCVLILLMITFHIVYVGDTYGAAKQFVYTFHMPAFLLVSGYLCNTAKGAKEFLRAMFWIFIPYLVMETGYVVMASLLPIREHIDNLTAGVLLEKVFLHPLGPYWYLHTWVLCSLVYYGAMRIGSHYPSTQKAEMRNLPTGGRIVQTFRCNCMLCGAWLLWSCEHPKCFLFHGWCGVEAIWHRILARILSCIVGDSARCAYLTIPVSTR